MNTIELRKLRCSYMIAWWNSRLSAMIISRTNQKTVDSYARQSYPIHSLHYFERDGNRRPNDDSGIFCLGRRRRGVAKRKATLNEN